MARATIWFSIGPSVRHYAAFGVTFAIGKRALCLIFFIGNRIMTFGPHYRLEG